MDPRGIGWEVVDWIHLAQDQEQWRGISSLAERLLASQEGLYCMEVVR
jgi:hypothetical protein